MCVWYGNTGDKGYYIEECEDSGCHTQQIPPLGSHAHTIEALRYDTGKPELHHIHPEVWRQGIINPRQLLDGADNALNQWFYYDDVSSLQQVWQTSAKLIASIISPVLSFGAKKYASLNYTNGMAFSRVLNSWRRHLLAIANGETTDPESGLSHEAHALCNFMFVVCYVLTGVGTDDRVLLEKK